MEAFEREIECFESERQNVAREKVAMMSSTMFYDAKAFQSHF